MFKNFGKMSKSFEVSGVTRNDALDRSADVPPFTSAAAENGDEELKAPIVQNVRDILGDSSERNHMILPLFSLNRNRDRRTIHNQR